MRYHFYICKSNGNLFWLQKHLRHRKLRNVYYVDSFESGGILEAFDIEQTTERLLAASYECEGVKPSFQIYNFSKQYCPLIVVTTEFSRAQEVAEKLSECLNTKELVIIDKEMDCLTNIKKEEREKFVKVRCAYQRIKLAIFHDFLPKNTFKNYGNFAFFKLGECFWGYDAPVIDSAIAVLKHIDFRIAVKHFNDVLEKALDADEKLYCLHGCFVVENAKLNYRFRFVLEGSGKSPLYMGWMENGEVRLEMLRRQGIYRTILRIRDKGIDEEDYVRSCLYFAESFPTRSDWRNPADRFVDSYKLSQRIEKNNLEIIYGRHPTKTYCDACSFMTQESSNIGWDAWKLYSMFDISESYVVPLLALIEDNIPNYDYYLNSPVIRKEKIEMMLERLKTIRLQIIKNPSDPSLGKFAKRLLSCSEFAWHDDDENSPFAENDDQRKENLFKNRFRILALLDFFGWWMKELLDNPKVVYNGFYVIGP